MTIPWHFTPQPADLPIEQVRERFDHPEMPEKMELICGNIFWDDTQRFHLFGLLIEDLGTEAVESLPPETSSDILSVAAIGNRR
ncbi:hypothetical protein [Prosthecobacter sp.]|jgi:hypothetical protein|uniref:hypothetical protein n=1 Tax=Prosthecobacter sp. TaxID=1965333 RepID=UPI0037837AE9